MKNNKVHYEPTWQLPDFEIKEYRNKKTKYCIGIPVINEGERLKKQLEKMKKFSYQADIIIFDGGSSDGSLESGFLKKQNVRALLIKKSSGKQGTQLRMGIAYILKEGYLGLITIDGNNKDGIDKIPVFIKKLEEGYDLVQGSRYIQGGQEINTPLLRHIGNHLILAPLFSWASGFHYTDVTNGFRGYSKKFLYDPRVNLFRDIFISYELMFYLAVKAAQLKLKISEVPVLRQYPKGEIPTKISGVSALWNVLLTGIKAASGYYNP